MVVASEYSVTVDGRELDSHDGGSRIFESRMIDVARGIAIMLVLVVHVTSMIVAPAASRLSPAISKLLGYAVFGASGVALFFVISGYLLNMLYSGDNFSPGKFWLRRIGRIYPAWIFWTVVSVTAASVPIGRLLPGVAAYGNGVRPDSLLNVGLIALHLGFLGFLVPAIWNTFIPGGWSIQAEMFNYALHPLMRRSPFRLVLLAAVVLEAVHFALGFLPDPLAGEWAAIAATYLTAPVWFAIGVFLSRATARVKSPVPSDELAREAGLVVCILAFAIVGGLRGPFVSEATSVAVVAAGATLAYFLVRADRWRAFAQVGKYSYGIYFSHFLFIAPFAWAARRLTQAASSVLAKILVLPMLVTFFALTLASSFLVARVVFEAVERRPLDWARRRTRAKRSKRKGNREGRE